MMMQWIARPFASTGIRRRGKCLSLALLMVSSGSNAQFSRGASPALSPAEIIARMEQAMTKRVEQLPSYRAQRRYSVSHPLVGNSSYLLVEERFSAPEEKQFRVLERGGPRTIEKRVFQRLLQVERDTARSPAREAVDLCRRNYNFTFHRYDSAVGAYIFEVEPRTSNPYLLRGRIWVNGQDYGVQRIEGEPARRHSSLVRQTRFVHEFVKFGDFWFPVRHHSETDLILFGRATLEIAYFDYQWEPRQEAHQ